ncbi:hypothetical protein [Streptomyces sp. NPDC049915]|uniref:hypothetical protein n=1 Tax=Streptomyces sp. NPDC049915 TaxID=3155510 RepID=UPI003437B08F
MTMTETEAPAQAEDTNDVDLGTLPLRAATSRRERAAAQALLEEGTILGLPRVRQALVIEDADGRPVCRWDNMMGRLYTLGLDEDDRTFLGLVLSLLPIGLFTLSAAQDLDERRLQILLRAIVTLSGNDRIAVGTRL